MQRLVVRHHPQGPIGVQVSQLVAEEQLFGTSRGGPASKPGHMFGSQFQLAPVQELSVELVELPARQRLLVRHHPHPALGVQSPQLVAAAQLAPPSPPPPPPRSVVPPPPPSVSTPPPPPPPLLHESEIGKPISATKVNVIDGRMRSVSW